MLCRSAQGSQPKNCALFLYLRVGSSMAFVDGVSSDGAVILVYILKHGTVRSSIMQSLQYDYFNIIKLYTVP